MAGPANDPPDAKMLELVSSEKTTPELTRESSSFLNDDGLKSNGPLTTALVHEENGARTSRESVLRRLSEALMRRSLAEVRSISASVLFFLSEKVGSLEWFLLSRYDCGCKTVSRVAHYSSSSLM